MGEFEGVGLTAVAMARERAAESARADALFDDPWARSLVEAALADLGAESPAWLDGDLTLGDIAPGMAGYVAMRTRWLDDRIRARVAEDGATQVVLAGAGLDTRSARLDFPHPVTVFSVDRAEVLSLAGRVLGGESRAVAVPADLTGDWPAELVALGFDASAKTVWVAEGVLMYLSEVDASRLLEVAHGLSGAGGHLLADLAHPNIHHNALFAPGRETLRDNNSPIRCAIGDPVSWLASLGWQATVTDPLALAERYGRPVPPALDPRPADGPTCLFVEAAV